MKATEAITNLHTDDVERAREFLGFLGLTEETMNQGWVARFGSADSGACVQVVTRGATASEDSVMTIKVDDVDAAYREAHERGLIKSFDRVARDFPMERRGVLV